MNTIVIKDGLPTLNEQISCDRASKYKGSALKKNATLLCKIEAKNQCKNRYKNIHLDFHWIEKDKRRDKDNIAFAKKYFLDGLVNAGIIENDGWKHIEGFTDKFSVDKENPRLEVTVREIFKEKT